MMDVRPSRTSDGCPQSCLRWAIAVRGDGVAPDKTFEIMPPSRSEVHGNIMSALRIRDDDFNILAHIFDKDSSASLKEIQRQQAPSLLAVCPEIRLILNVEESMAAAGVAAFRSSQRPSSFPSPMHSAAFPPR